MLDDSTSQLLVILFLPVATGFLCLLLKEMFAARAGTPAALCSSEPPRIPRSMPGILAIADAYDPDRELLWETQIPALQRIARKASIAELRTCWRDMQRYPELYEGISFETWLGSLQLSSIVEWDGRSARLTPEGREFLNSLTRYRDPALQFGQSGGIGA